MGTATRVHCLSGGAVQWVEGSKKRGHGELEREEAGLWNLLRIQSSSGYHK